MKIGMILDTSFPPDYRVENEAYQLIKKGHEVYLFSVTIKPKKNYEKINGIHVVRYKISKWLQKLSALAYTLPVYHWLMRSKIADFIDRTGVNVLHVHDMVIAQAVFEVNKMYQLPIVLDLHENRPAIMSEYKHVNSFPGRWLIDLDKWKNKQKEFVRKADYVLVVTKYARNTLFEECNVKKDKVFVISNTINPDLFTDEKIFADKVQHLKGFFNVIYLGNTAIRRGTDNAIKAVNLLKNRIDNIKLVLVGDSSEDNTLKKMVCKLGVEDNVSFEGWQHYKFFPSYLSVSEIGISPLKRNLHHDTTYANKLFQYMAMSMPLLVSDCPAQKKLIEKVQCGVVFKANNPEEMANKIYYLYKNDEKRLKMGENGYNFVQNKFNWDRIGKELNKLYSLIERK